MCWNLLSFWIFWNLRGNFFWVKKPDDRHHSDHIRHCKKKVAQNVLKHTLVLEFFKIKWCVYLAYFRSYGLFKISKYIEMYWKLMFKTDRTLVLEFSKSDKKIFRLGWGGQKNICSECVETCFRFGIFESEKKKISLKKFIESLQTDTIVTR